MSELSHYDYELPRELIAQAPLFRRTDARLLVVHRESGQLEHRRISDLPDLFRQHDCLVLNDTRVVPARLAGVRTLTGGRWEGLFISLTSDGHWRLMGKSRGKLQPGETITLLDRRAREDTRLRLIEKQAGGIWLAHPETDEPTFDLLERVGRIPLPHYIRGGKMTDADRRQYQTVYARNPGAVAAPTAGLHFTDELLVKLIERGLDVARVTLHVGPGTFRPITAEKLSEHVMHSEWGEILPGTVETIERAKGAGGRLIAVGTTSMRVLETAASSGRLQPWSGETQLFIRPPFQFHAVDALLTNFHLPKSTLLVLVRTFGGDELMRHAYEEAVRREYRFFSYGDAMLIL